MTVTIVSPATAAAVTFIQTRDFPRNVTSGGVSSDSRTVVGTGMKKKEEEEEEEERDM